MNKSTAEYVAEAPTNPARLGARWAAHWVDLILFILLIFIGNQLGGWLGQFNSSFSHIADLMCLVAVAYALFCDALPGGQSVGKRLLKIRVVSDVSHTDCTPLRSLARNAARILAVVDLIPLLFGSRKRIGDMVASTIVITAERR